MERVKESSLHNSSYFFQASALDVVRGNTLLCVCVREREREREQKKGLSGGASRLTR